MMNALGMIEVYGYLTAVEALDSALKAANVNLLEVTKVKGGLVTVFVTGDVGAVKASMDASAAAAERVGRVVSVHVIPRPAGDTMRLFPDAPLKKTDKLPKAPVVAQTPPKVAIDEHASKMEVPTLEELEKMTVVQLRGVARAVGVKSISKKEIKFAKRETLLKVICELFDRSGN